LENVIALSDRSKNAKEYRKLYRTKRWRELRLRVFIRDNYKCQKTGAILYQQHPKPFSPVADHIKPHKGNLERFYNIDNIQTVSKQYHDSAKQSLERIGYSKEVGVDGWPVDGNHPANGEGEGKSLDRFAYRTGDVRNST
jgi:5-methylcytosine-specific restriction enzyme A